METVAVKKTNLPLVIFGIVIGAPLAIIIALIFVSKVLTAGLSTDQRMAADSQALAQSSMKRAMRDPDSAIFRDVQQGSSPRVVCGQINGKNAFGGLTGFRKFVVNYDDGTTAFEGGAGFEATWAADCAGFMER